MMAPQQFPAGGSRNGGIRLRKGWTLRLEDNGDTFALHPPKGDPIATGMTWQDAGKLANLINGGREGPPC